MDHLELDTRWVLNRDYTAETLRNGYIGAETPIFDNLAAERFAGEGT